MIAQIGAPSDLRSARAPANSVTHRMTLHSALVFNPRYLWLKRVMDVVLTTIALIPFGLVIAVAALAVRLDSPGPVLFRQKRIGANGVEFEMLKLRSMYHNCDQTLQKAISENWMKGVALNSDKALAFKKVDDPRITRVGRIIRRFSIDELPQLWNVLRGEMTIVGPRPPMPNEVRDYTSRAQLRLCGKPGLTGPWQVDGRGVVNFATMVEQDITYLQRQSLFYDLALMVLTVPVLLTGRGAG